LTRQGGGKEILQPLSSPSCTVAYSDVGKYQATQ
jgi:hypothetical protein